MISATRVRFPLPLLPLSYGTPLPLDPPRVAVRPRGEGRIQDAQTEYYDRQEPDPARSPGWQVQTAVA